MNSLQAKDLKQSFIEKNPSFVEIQVTNESKTLDGEFQEINDDDEIWLLQCPKGTDLTILEGHKLKLPGRSHVQEMEAVAVEFSKPLSESFGYCNRKGKYALRLLPLSGSVVLRNRLKANEMPTADEIETICPAPGRVPEPADIKMRHPLLGHQFEDKILVKSFIAERLRQADENSIKIMQEIRRKARKRTSVTTMKKPQLQTSIKSELVESTNEHTKSKNKKHKHMDRDVSTMDEDDVVSASASKKKKTKSKHESKDEISDDLSWLKNL